MRFETEGTWVLDGTELNVSNTQKYVTDRMRLTIRDLQFSDEGNYTCVFVQDGQHFVSLGDVLRIVGEEVREWEEGEGGGGRRRKGKVGGGVGGRK